MRVPAVLALALLAGPLLARSDTPDFIPLKKGTYWIYQGTISRFARTPDGQPTVDTKTIIWRSEVMGGPYPLYTAQGWLLHGSPLDLVWSSTDVRPADRLIVQVGTNFYQLAAMTDRKDEAFEQMKADIAAPNFNLDAHANELNRAQILCEFPLALGKRFDEADSKFADLVRTDRYCWSVEGVTDFDASKVKGFPPIKNPQVYEIAFRTSPDDSEMEIVPGVGLVGYHYHHHGTTMKVDVDLIEYHPAP